MPQVLKPNLWSPKLSANARGRGEDSCSAVVYCGSIKVPFLFLFTLTTYIFLSFLVLLEPALHFNIYCCLLQGYIVSSSLSLVVEKVNIYCIHDLNSLTPIHCSSCCVWTSLLFCAFTFLAVSGVGFSLSFCFSWFSFVVFFCFFNFHISYDRFHKKVCKIVCHSVSKLCNSFSFVTVVMSLCNSKSGKEFLKHFCTY